MLYTVIIDRIGNTNIFNIVHSDQVRNLNLPINETLYSIIDDDLIEEYLYELNGIASTSHSLLSQGKILENREKFKLSHINLNQKLKQIGYTLFKQFFPEALQDFLKNKSGTSLFFHLTKELSSLPIEIMHEGEAFLWEKFSIGKSIKGDYVPVHEITPKENIQMLIIADPNEDLEWAAKEGEFLFENLGNDFPEKNLSMQLIGGREVTKLSLLNMIREADIVHYCGHLHYSQQPQESGWLLFNNKIISTREIKNSGTKPLLIFANSCFSGRKPNKELNSSMWYSQFASSFLHSAKTSYIGTIWQLPDEEPTIEFTLHFYENLLKGMRIGIALQNARKYAKEKFELNDLTWASYILVGNPLSKIFYENQFIPDLAKNTLDHNKVLSEYPYVLAKPFSDFINTVKKVEKRSNTQNNRESLHSLSFLVQQIVYFLIALLSSHYKYYNINIEPAKATKDLKSNLDLIFATLKIMQRRNISILIPNLSKTLIGHKTQFYKLAEFMKTQPAKLEELQITLVAGQFIIESLLMNMEFLKHYGFYFITDEGTRQLSLLGLEKYHKVRDIVLPTQLNDQASAEIKEVTSRMIHKCVFYIPFKKLYLDLSDHIKVSLVKKRSGFKVKTIELTAP